MTPQQIFLHLAAVGNFTTARHELGMTNYEMKTVISKLEIEYGALFYRPGYSRLTERGVAMVREWQKQPVIDGSGNDETNTE